MKSTKKIIPLYLILNLLIPLWALSGNSRLTQPSERPALSIWHFDHMLLVRESLKKGEDTYRTSYKKLIQEAERILKERATSVMDKPDNKVAKSGDKHDFISVGKYCWPNPNTPDGMPWIQRDGYINVENFKKDDAVRQDKMVANVAKLCQAYFFSGDDRFAKKAVELARVWFIDPATRMNPHLTFAQVIPGNDNSMGHFPGVIFGRTYINLLAGLNLIKNVPAYTSEFDSGIKNGFRNMQRGLQQVISGRRKAKQPTTIPSLTTSNCWLLPYFRGMIPLPGKLFLIFIRCASFHKWNPTGKCRANWQGLVAWAIRHST